MICTKVPKTYSLSCDKVTDILTIIGLLYVRSKSKELKIYKLPVKHFEEYEVGSLEGYKNVFPKKPESKYLVQGSKKVKKQDSYDGSTSSKSNSKSNDSSEESKSPAKKDDFRKGDSGIELGNQLYEKLGAKFVEKQQEEMIDPKSSLIYRNRMKDHKAIKLRYGDIAIGKIDLHIGDSSGVVDCDSDDESNPSKDTFDEDEKSSSDKNQSSDSDDEIKLSDFKLIKMLNQGAFGKVFLARNTVDGQYYAMKRIRKDLLIKTKQIENTLSEKNILCLLGQVEIKDY